jgi:hypothetical protein
MTPAITARLAVASSMVQLRRAPKTAGVWAEPFWVGLLLEGDLGLYSHGRYSMTSEMVRLGLVELRTFAQ